MLQAIHKMIIFAFYQAIGLKNKTALATYSLKVFKLEIVEKCRFLFRAWQLPVKYICFYLRRLTLQPTYSNDKACEITILYLYS